MAINKGWIVAGVLIGGTVAVYLVSKQKKKKTGIPVIVPAPGGALATGTGSGNVAGQTLGPAGTNVYSKAGLTIRSSPQLDDGWFGSGFLGNLVTTIGGPNVFVGNIVSNTVDSNEAMDAAGNIYTWYRINPAPAYGSTGGSYYVREDYITIK
jgi:hypothetical protein